MISPPYAHTYSPVLISISHGRIWTTINVSHILLCTYCTCYAYNTPEQEDGPSLGILFRLSIPSCLLCVVLNTNQPREIVPAQHPHPLQVHVSCDILEQILLTTTMHMYGEVYTTFMVWGA